MTDPLKTAAQALLDWCDHGGFAPAAMRSALRAALASPAPSPSTAAATCYYAWVDQAQTGSVYPLLDCRCCGREPMCPACAAPSPSRDAAPVLGGVRADGPSRETVEAACEQLHRMLAKATTRLEILRDRNISCQEERVDAGCEAGHELSEVEVPGWLEEQRALLLTIARSLKGQPPPAAPADQSKETDRE